MEDGALLGQISLLHGLMRSIFQKGLVKGDKLHKIAQPEQRLAFINVAVGIQPELCRQQPPVVRVHTLCHFQTHDGGKAAFLQFGFDHRHKVLSVFFAAFRVGIARGSKHFAAEYGHAGKQQVKVVTHDLFKRNEAVAAIQTDKTRRSVTHRDLYPGKHRRLIFFLHERNKQVQRQVGDKRKGVRRVNATAA